MKEYFVMANSYAAPMCSDTSNSYISADTPEDALKKLQSKYRHPCGLFAAAVYNNADEYHKGNDPLLKFLDNKEKSL